MSEPAAWKVWNRMGGISFQLRKPNDSEYVEYDPLYTHPAKELTDEEIEECYWGDGYPDNPRHPKEFARAILRKAQEK
jgi:hypothetical protein